MNVIVGLTRIALPGGVGQHEQAILQTRAIWHDEDGCSSGYIGWHQPRRQTGELSHEHNNPKGF